VRAVNHYVMVRIGCNWEPIADFFERNDPCRGIRLAAENESCFSSSLLTHKQTRTFMANAHMVRFIVLGFPEIYSKTASQEKPNTVLDDNLYTENKSNEITAKML